jgi:hypothetical protein
MREKLDTQDNETYKNELLRYLKEKSDADNNKEKKRIIGFVDTQEINPFTHAKTTAELMKMFDKFEIYLRNKDPQNPTVMSSREDFDILNAFYQEQYRKIKARQNHRLGFVNSEPANDNQNKKVRKNSIGFIEVEETNPFARGETPLDKELNGQYENQLQLLRGKQSGLIGFIQNETADHAIDESPAVNESKKERMKKKNKIGFTVVFLMITGLSFFFLPARSMADGLMVGNLNGDRWGYMPEDSQTAFINYYKGKERMVVAVDIGSASSAAVWILPVPGEPQDIKADADHGQGDG